MSRGVDALAFGAHPDDVEIFCGGVMVRLAQLGYRTGVIDLTRGELASRGTPEERAREADAAAKVLGLAFRENLGLPDGSGLDLLREWKGRPPAPVIVLTGELEDRTLEEVRALGATVLTKPFSPSKLAAQVARLAGGEGEASR